ncbi:MAG: DUF4224 domain-containing protein [Pseudomonadota bacterium]|nr:DUF4224 domain-containing protein [Pseudomonadota bacterium]
MFLTPDELVSLTGYKKAASQREWLALRGWKFEIDGHGKPVVLANYAVARLSGNRSNALPSSPLPNYDAIN